MADVTATATAPATSRAARMRRGARRLLKQCAIAFALVAATGTVFSFIYNRVTQDTVPAPPGLTYIRTGDMMTRYREWGTTGTPILLLHGFVESADTWDPTAELLARDHRVYAIDLDGFGYTQRVAPYTTAHLTTQVLDFISAMHLVRPILVGHSSGAAVAGAVALAAPNEVSGVMFLDGDGLPLSETADGGRDSSGFDIPIPNPYRTTLLRLILRSDTMIQLIYAETCGPSCAPLTEAGIEQWRRPFQVPGAEAAAFQVLSTGIPSLPVSTLEGIAALPMPKSVVYGSDDPEYQPDSAQQTADRIGAPAPTLIPGARHLTMISSPGAVAAAIEKLAARAG